VLAAVEAVSTGLSPEARRVCARQSLRRQVLLDRALVAVLGEQAGARWASGWRPVMRDLVQRQRMARRRGVPVRNKLVREAATGCYSADACSPRLARAWCRGAGGPCPTYLSARASQTDHRGHGKLQTGGRWPVAGSAATGGPRIPPCEPRSLCGHIKILTMSPWLPCSLSCCLAKRRPRSIIGRGVGGHQILHGKATLPLHGDVPIETQNFCLLKYSARAATSCCARLLRSSPSRSKCGRRPFARRCGAHARRDSGDQTWQRWCGENRGPGTCLGRARTWMATQTRRNLHGQRNLLLG